MSFYLHVYSLSRQITTDPDQVELLWGFLNVYGEAFTVYEGTAFYAYCYHVSTTDHSVTVTAPGRLPCLPY